MDETPQSPSALIDPFGRSVTYLRLSVTDRCDLRCLYCMNEDMSFLPKAKVLTLEETYRIAAAFVSLGVNKIRVTGGEPLVRNNMMWLLEQLSPLSGLHELVLTTNGIQLEKYAEPLRKAGVRRLNISLDTLNPDRFKTMTRVGQLQRVLAGIDAARNAGFERIKLNVVMLKGFNDDEVQSLVEFACEKGVDIVFIEEMPLGHVGTEYSRHAAHVPSADILQQIRERYRVCESLVNSGGPSRYYTIDGLSTRVGFISPHSNNFCGQCNRVRLTAEGRLLLCLGHEHSVDLRAVVRAHPVDDQPLRDAIIAAMQLKPEKHTFNLEDDQPQVVRFMNMTGG